MIILTIYFLQFKLEFNIFKNSIKSWHVSKLTFHIFLKFSSSGYFNLLVHVVNVKLKLRWIHLGGARLPVYKSYSCTSYFWGRLKFVELGTKHPAWHIKELWYKPCNTRIASVHHWLDLTEWQRYFTWEMRRKET